MAAFVQRATMSVRNANTEPDIEGSRSVLLGAGIQAAVSVPVELQGGPIGTLDIYSATPRDWDDSELGALQAYAGIVAPMGSNPILAPLTCGNSVRGVRVIGR